MARPESEPKPRPLTDDEHEEVRAAIRDLQDRTRAYLARELGGDSEDYAADSSAVNDTAADE